MRGSVIMLNVIEFEGTKEREWLIYKYPKTDIVLGSTLIVRNAQEAVIIKGGELLKQEFKEGTYVLDTGNVPGLSKFVNRIYDKSPFIAEVYYVNLISKLNRQWGSRKPIKVIDPDTDHVKGLRLTAQYCVRVIDAQKFIERLIGAIPQGTMDDFNLLSDFMNGVIDPACTSTISRKINTEHISVYRIIEYLYPLSNEIEDILHTEFRRYGIDFFDFHLRNIDVIDIKPEEGTETFYCPNCGTSISKEIRCCPACGSEVYFKNLHSVFSINEQKLKNYMAGYGKRKEDNSEVYKAKGLGYLRLKTYEQAKNCFSKAIALDYEDSSAYYFMALTLCKGKRPFSILFKDIKKIIEYLETAIQLENNGMYYYLYALLIYDFYEHKKLNYKTTSQEMLQQAKIYGVNKEDMNIIDDYLGISMMQN